MGIKDILDNGKDNMAHLENLRTVFTCTMLSQAGLRLMQNKCCFMQAEGNQLWLCDQRRRHTVHVHTVHVHPVAAKIDAIKNAPTPKDVTQLHAFLGNTVC